ncbi:MAG: YDG domain-containing protein [Paludibacteraceae bacterium]
MAALQTATTTALPVGRAIPAKAFRLPTGYGKERHLFEVELFRRMEYCRRKQLSLPACAFGQSVYPPVLTISGTFTVSDKVFDGTTAATITSQSLTLAGIASGDAVTIAGATAVFSDANVGTNKTVTLTSVTLAGSAASKYLISLTGAPAVTANIIPATPAAPTLSGRTATSVTLNTVAGCEYRVNGGTWQDSPVFTGLTPSTAYGFTQRVKATSNSNASAESGALTVMTNIAGGSGTSADPWQITTAAELDAVRNNLLAYYKVMNDIDLTSYVASGGAGYNGGEGWNPIGSDADRFTGTFDGGGYIISGLAINRPSSSQTASTGCGLFGYSNGTVKNVVLKDAVMAGYAAVGLVGFNRGGTISGCCVTGNSSFTGAFDCVGGIVGYNEAGTVTNCYSYASVSATRNVGGLAGYSNRDGTIQYCYANGVVSHSGDAFGSFLGQNEGTVTNCYYNSDINLFGDSYGTGKTTAEMKQQATYIGWDFAGVWKILEGAASPKLQWQSWTDDEIITADGLALTWNAIKGTNTAQDNVTENLILPAAGTNGSAIAWSVSGGGENWVNTVDGSITRPTAGNKTVTLTASLTYGTGSIRTKDFTLTIIKDISTEAHSANGTGLRMYPNPVSDWLYIETESMELPDVRLYSLQGKLLLQTKGNKLNLQGLAEGIYVLDVDGSKVKVVKK